MKGTVAGMVALCWAGAAHADPCQAIPEKGPMPVQLAFGQRFSGPVVHVIDGDSMCVALGPDQQSWAEVRLADFYAPELSAPAGPAAKAALERLVMGREAVCVANMRTYDRVAARCRIEGRPIGDLMRGAGVAEGGAAYGRSVTAPTRPNSPVSSGGSGMFYSCKAARAAGAAPMHRGSAGYNPNLDGDGDGIACEPHKGR